MLVLSPDIKLALLFSLTFAASLFVGVIIIMHSVGNMANHLGRMEDLITKELVLRYNQQINYFKQQKQRELVQQDRDRRQEALLAIPLVRNQTQHDSKGASK